MLSNVALVPKVSTVSLIRGDVHGVPVELTSAQGNAQGVTSAALQGRIPHQHSSSHVQLRWFPEMILPVVQRGGGYLFLEIAQARQSRD